VRESPRHAFAAGPDRRFQRFSIGVLGLNLGVILWGALVRATGSGAGCGSHWPLCNGEVIPPAPAQETLIEFGHRVLSGLALVSVALLWFWAARRYGRATPVRRWAWGALALVVVEALVGAGLVLMRWVADDASTGRAVSIAVHLIITYGLLACLGLVAWYAGVPSGISTGPRIQPAVAGFLVVGMVLVGITGAITALGDTLFPAETLAQGMSQDFASEAHFLVRLRVIHPLAAIAVAAGLLVWEGTRRRGLGTEASEGRWLSTLRWIVVLQLVAGVVNVIFLAPVWMQILHLLLADLAWLALIVCLAQGLSATPRGLPEPEARFA
jgi:heme a synthase